MKKEVLQIEYSGEVGTETGLSEIPRQGHGGRRRRWVYAIGLGERIGTASTSESGLCQCLAGSPDDSQSINLSSRAPLIYLACASSATVDDPRLPEASGGSG